MPFVNVVVVSHCNFKGNSALHVYAIACELQQRGFSPVVVVPDHPEGVDDLGRPSFPVLAYSDALTDALRFPDGRGPDLVYAFTPRELVRAVTVGIIRAHGCLYIVHLEDDEQVVLSAELGVADAGNLRTLPLPVLDRIVQPRQSHPLRAARFLAQSAGMTVLIDTLLEFVPDGVPAVVMRAGFDEAMLTPRQSRESVRAQLGLDEADIAIAYTGNIHSVNLEEMRSLYTAVAQLRRDGQRAVLVKTGGGSDVAARFGFPTLGAGLRDLGWVPRSTVPEILAAADVLVQPGGPSRFNNARFPSKLPEYLASGRPVVLPRTNVGLELRDGVEALVLEHGNAPEIAAAVTLLAADPALRARIGEAGRAFALRELRWPRSVDRLEQLLGEIAADERPAAPAWVLEGADPPVKLIAFVPAFPGEPEAISARTHGIFGFCVEATPMLEQPTAFPPGIPFCLRSGDADQGLAAGGVPFFSKRDHIRVGGAPLILTGDGMVETAVPPEQAYDDAMRERLALPLPDGLWFRTIAYRSGPGNESIYAVWLRKLVFQTAIRGSAQEPLLFVDPGPAWTVAAEREAWLEVTRSALADGIRQFYASRRIGLSRSEAEALVRAT